MYIKNIKYLSILISLCLLMMSCTSKTFHTANIKHGKYKNIQFTVWYYEENMTIPLLASLEWKNPSDKNPQLGLVLLQGKRFAQCILQENSMQCILDESLSTLLMQKIANQTAQCIINSCLVYENRVSKTYQEDMQGWKLNIIDKKNYSFAQTSSTVEIQVNIEEVITWP